MQKVLDILHSSCFHLRNFGSNAPKLLAGMDSQMVGTVHNLPT